jgi:hypothetical protein
VRQLRDDTGDFFYGGENSGGRKSLYRRQEGPTRDARRAGNLSCMTRGSTAPLYLELRGPTTKQRQEHVGLVQVQQR